MKNNRRNNVNIMGNNRHKYRYPLWKSSDLKIDLATLTENQFNTVVIRHNNILYKTSQVV